MRGASNSRYYRAHGYEGFMGFGETVKRRDFRVVVDEVDPGLLFAF